MTREEIFKTLLEIFVASTDGEIDPKTITPESDIYEDLGVSSISAIYMALEIEKRFGLSLRNEDASSFRKVSDMLDYIEGGMTIRDSVQMPIDFSNFQWPRRDFLVGLRDIARSHDCVFGPGPSGECAIFGTRRHPFMLVKLKGFEARDFDESMHLFERVIEVSPSSCASIDLLLLALGDILGIKQA